MVYLYNAGRAFWGGGGGVEGIQISPSPSSPITSNFSIILVRLPVTRFISKLLSSEIHNSFNHLGIDTTAQECQQMSAPFSLKREAASIVTPMSPANNSLLC